MSTVPDTAVAEQLIERDRQLLIHPYLAGANPERVVMTEGSGCRLRDIEGRDYLDATGGLWLAQIGHGRSEIADVASEQMRRLEYFTSFWEFSNDRAIELAGRLVELAPDPLRHVYFTSGGSESNEAALRMSRYFHSRRGQAGRDWILARRSAYHGIGYGSGSASGLPIYHEGFGPMLPHVRHLTPPWPYRAELFDGCDPTDFCLEELERTIYELGGDRIAAMIGEPIMGVGGMLVPPADYWPRVRELLSEHGILLIFDEVVTAFGRTGSWFGAQHFGVAPDLIVTAKGITSGYVPLGVVYSTLALSRLNWLVKPGRAGQLVPALRRDGLRSCALYADAWTNDARLCLENVVEAAMHGATVLNRAEVVSLSLVDGRVSGAEVEVDGETVTRAHAWSSTPRGRGSTRCAGSRTLARGRRSA